MDRGPPILGDLDLNGHIKNVTDTEYFPPSRPSHSPSQRRNTHLSVKSDIMTEFANEILVLEIPVFRDKSLVSLFQLENGIR